MFEWVLFFFRHKLSTHLLLTGRSCLDVPPPIHPDTRNPGGVKPTGALAYKKVVIMWDYWGKSVVQAIAWIYQHGIVKASERKCGRVKVISACHGKKRPNRDFPCRRYIFLPWINCVGNLQKGYISSFYRN